MVKDLSKVSNLELYKIAKDENKRMKDRYAAARELKERRKRNAFCRD